MAQGCFSCCGKNDETPKKANPLRAKRICKDILCCFLFLAFCGSLMFIFALGIAAGDWQALVYDADYLGERCGVDGRPPKAFYPRVPLDLSEQPEIIATQQYWNLELYALCVDECPKEFNVASPKFIADYGWSNGAPNNPTTSAIVGKDDDGSRAFWPAATPTTEVLNRCVPRIDANSQSETMCVLPNCTSPEAVAVGAVCTTNLDFGALAWPMSGDVQKSACEVEAKQTKAMQYQISTGDEAGKAALASLAGVVGGFFEVVASMRGAIWLILAFGILAPICVAVLYMILLYLFTRTIIYGLLVLLVVVELIATFISFARSGLSIGGVSGASIIDAVSNDANQSLPDYIGDALGDVDGGSNWIYQVCFWILLILTLITIVTIVLYRKKISICASIIKEATTVFKDVPTMLLFPVFSAFAQVLVCAWFVVGFIMLRTTKAESYDLVLNMNTTASDPIAGLLRDVSDSGNLKNAMILFHLYGFFVIYQWVGGMSWTTMSMTTGWWYFFKGDKDNRSRAPLLRSLFLVTVFHSGSVAFAAFIIAIFDLLRTIVAYIQRQMEAIGTNNLLTKVAFCCLGCCISCIQKTVKMISYYGLVFVATNGQSFCSACWSTAKFFVKHAGQVTVNGVVIWLIKLISVLTAPIACAIVGFYACDSSEDVDHPIWPAAAIFFCAVLMTTACMNVFDCTITTIFVCCFEDQEKYESQYMLQPHHSALAKVFNKKPAASTKAALTPKEAPADPETDKLVTA